MQLLLQGQGLDVRAYANGMPLLADPASNDAACFIADYRLDGEDGIAVLQALRGRGWNGPAILVTAFSSYSLTQRAIEAGFTSVFEKPLREHTLVDTVLRLVRQPDGAS
jgi:FixJ family two-component response regulator